MMGRLIVVSSSYNNNNKIMKNSNTFQLASSLIIRINNLMFKI